MKFYQYIFRSSCLIVMQGKSIKWRFAEILDCHFHNQWLVTATNIKCLCQPRPNAMDRKAWHWISCYRFHYKMIWLFKNTFQIKIDTQFLFSISGFEGFVFLKTSFWIWCQTRMPMANDPENFNFIASLSKISDFIIVFCS